MVEDDPAVALLHQEFLADEEYIINTVETASEALEAVQYDLPDVVLLDLGLPDMDGIELIKEIQKISRHCEIIVLTGETSVESALQAIQMGARDYLVKPVKKQRLSICIQNAVDRVKLARQLDKFTGGQDAVSFHGLVGRSTTMLNLYKTLENVAKHDDPVFITGESGSGKTLCAQTIHKLSARADKPFIVLNCLSLDAGSVKAELSDALASVQEGTLCLECVTSLDEEGQVELLKTLDAHKGLHIICSSNTPPSECVKDGSFREGLYYRLNILPLNIPPLRERDKDISLLANYFLKTLSQEKEKNFKEFDYESLKAFENHHWPGNVRELKNLIKNIVVVNADAEIVEVSMLPKELISVPAEASNENRQAQTGGSNNIFDGQDVIAIRDLEQMAITHALNVCNGNVQEAALRLKISPATLYRKKPSS